LSSDAFWTFSPYEVDEESSWRIITIFASKNGSVCCEVRTYFESYPFARFTKKISGRIITIYVSENEVDCSEVQTHFGSSLPTSFADKVLGTYSRFLHPKTKLFAVKFRRFLEVLCLQGLQKNFWVHFHDLCVRKRSCFL